MTAILDRAAVAGLLGIDAETVTRYLHRYPAGHAFEFPRPDGRIGRSPYWNAGRTTEIAAWRGPGRGAGAGRPRASSAG